MQLAHLTASLEGLSHLLHALYHQICKFLLVPLCLELWTFIIQKVYQSTSGQSPADQKPIVISCWIDFVNLDNALKQGARYHPATALKGRRLS